MIAYIQGKPIQFRANSVIIMTESLGYEVHVSEETLKKIRARENEILGLWLHHAVREDSEDLYGFLDENDLELFTALLGVSGIGPKTALGVLSVAGSETLRQGISSGDPAYLSKTTGIGKKTAEKIVFELSGKLMPISTSATSTHEDDVIDGLKSLGYQERQIREVMKKLDTKDKDSSIIIKEALKLLSS